MIRRASRRAGLALALVAALAGAATWAGGGVSGRDAGGTPSARVSPVASPTPVTVRGARQSRLFNTDRSMPLKVVALGDSIQSGHNCDCADYVSTVASTVADTLGRRLELHNTAVSGFRTDDVLGLLQEDEVRAAIAEAELVVVEIGANDFDPDAEKNVDAACLPVETGGCFTDDMAAMTGNLRRILTDVHALQKVPRARLVVLGYWNVFPEGDVGRSRGETYLAVGDQLTRWSNKETAALARSVGGIYADAYTPFKGDGSTDDANLLAPDGEHPDAAGHQALADAVLDALQRTRSHSRGRRASSPPPSAPSSDVVTPTAAGASAS